MRRETIEKGVGLWKSRRATPWPSAKVISVEGADRAHLVVYYPPAGAWVCDCRAAQEDVSCSHVLAAKLLDLEMGEGQWKR